jgi:hypothetical protein
VAVDAPEEVRNIGLPDGIPERTLGWDVLDWGSTYLVQPDGDFQYDLWKYTDEQARFLLWFYAVDERGRWLYNRAMLMRSKGWGKSPLLAAISCTELLGPVVFDGWNASGEPVGKPQRGALVQLCAVSKDQTDNTMSLIMEMLGENSPAYDNYRLDVGSTRVIGPGGSKLQPVTASPRSREGQRATFAVFDETHQWLENNNGKALAATVRRNLGKMNRRSIETTNAFLPGEMSVAEASYEHYLKGAGKMLLDYRAADENIDIHDKDAAMRGLRQAYGNAAWIDLDRIWEETQDPVNTEADVKRFYFNWIVQGAMQWMDPVKWAAQARPGEEIPDGTQITLGFDGGIHDDATALIACRVSDGHIFPIKVWERPDGQPDWTVSKGAVKAKIRECFARFDVVWMDGDPAYWQDDLGELSLEFPGRVWEWWCNRPSAMAKCLERFHTAIYAGELTHDADPTLDRHVLNALRKETAWGDQIEKPAKGSSRKIDAAVAACLAYEARAEWLEAQADENEPGEIWGF